MDTTQHWHYHNDQGDCYGDSDTLDRAALTVAEYCATGLMFLTIIDAPDCTSMCENDWDGEYDMSTNTTTNSTPTSDDRNAMCRDMISDALRQVTSVEQRLVGTGSAILDATRAVDRMTLAAGIDSMRLTLSVVHELLRDLDGSLPVNRERKEREELEEINEAIRYNRDTITFYQDRIDFLRTVGKPDVDYAALEIRNCAAQIAGFEHRLQKLRHERNVMMWGDNV